MNSHQIMIERYLKEYLGKDKANKIYQYGTPEHTLLMKLTGTASVWDYVGKSGRGTNV